MKTILIYDQQGVVPIEFYVYDGDATELNGVYVNDGQNEAHEERLLSIVESHEKLTEFPISVARGDGAVSVIVCGFLQ